MHCSIFSEWVIFWVASLASTYSLAIDYFVFLTTKQNCCRRLVSGGTWLNKKKCPDLNIYLSSRYATLNSCYSYIQIYSSYVFHQQMGGSKCCVPGCKSNYNPAHGHISVFKFPSDDERKTDWVSLIISRLLNKPNWYLIIYPFQYYVSYLG